MNDDEVTAIYLGALMVICIQLTVIGLIGNYEATAPNFVVAPAHQYTITIARFLSYYMMHLNVEPEIRNGLILCKYCLNHPGCFKEAIYHDKDGKRRINVIAVLPPFSLAIGQVLIGIIVEFFVLIYLTSLQKLMDVIIRFVAMAAICKFDDMYAASLFETKMKACAGKRLQKKYNRHMNWIMTQWQEEQREKRMQGDMRSLEDNNIPEYDPKNPKEEKPLYYKNKPFYRNPRNGSCCLTTMRVIVKSIRMFYVSVIYYFMPFFFTFVTFIMAIPLLNMSKN